MARSNPALVAQAALFSGVASSRPSGKKVEVNLTIPFG
jgi:hypothetical protein